MPPALAALVFAAGIVGLFALERSREKTAVSWAIWIPIVWMCIGASRPLSFWLGAGGGASQSPDVYLEGSPLDRWLLTALLTAGLMVLVSRGARTTEVIRNNWPILLFFIYCAFSVTWSDFPFVSAKRLIKAAGNLTMALVIFTDPAPVAALKRLLSGIGYILVPTSVLFVKYYPELGRGYDKWTGRAYYSGVTVDKNALGAVCLVCGLGALWLCLSALFERPLNRRQFVAYGTLLGSTVWLLVLSASATSLLCFVVGASLLVVLTLRPRAGLVHACVFLMILLGAVGYFLLDGKAFLLESLGRDATLTGRTELWSRVLEVDTNPLLGTGFESFWLGERLERLWAIYWWHPNQAHNGYIELYLNLGWVGVSLLFVQALTGYRHVVRACREASLLAGLRFAFIVTTLLYSLTEATFKVMHPLWIAFLCAAMYEGGVLGSEAVKGRGRARSGSFTLPPARSFPLPASAGPGVRFAPSAAPRRRVRAGQGSHTRASS